MLSSTEIMLYI